MNIREVARVARVSTATVSRTINGSDKVAPETAERVREAIHKLKFYPNNNARALGSGRSSLYGLIISDITNPFFPELVRSFEEIAVQYGQEVLVANTNYDPIRMETCVRRMLQRKVDGVAILTSEMEAHLIDEFSSRRIPMVFLDMGVPSEGISNIVLDYPAGVDAAVQHLSDLGHVDIGFISGPMNLTSARIRHQAFLASLKRKRIRLNPSFVEEGDHRMGGGHDAMARLLNRPVRPTAILASNDMTAIGAMGAIFEQGLSVPEDISVIGFDDIDLSSFTQPPLTTIRVSRPDIARTAFRALYSSNQDTPPQGAEFTIHPTLIERKSTGRMIPIGSPRRQQKSGDAGIRFGKAQITG
ncbi:LacI family DNA-binding transcriptional regulator [Acidisarcina polymorpha]|nr:LacI family DNA-binding transcriptional regulator [Acidisarcina polymorpha]